MKSEGGLRTKGVFKESIADKPLLSIITVVFKGEKHIEQTITSVLQQTYDNVEYIIIDGGSTDRTLDIIKKHEDKIDYWQSEADQGIYDAMNKGLALAKGDIIGMINADDFYYPHAAELVVKAFQSQSKPSIYHSNMHVFAGRTDSTPFISIGDISQISERPSINHPTCFVDKRIYEHVGKFDTQFKISSDYEFLLRCRKHGYDFVHISQVLVGFRTGGMSDSCASNVEGYKIMKKYQTGHQHKLIYRGLKCYTKKFIKKVLVFLHIRKSPTND